MEKIAIVYKSTHHGNTKKLIDAIVSAFPYVKAVEAGAEAFNPSEYDCIGFASGIYMGKAHRALRKFINTWDLSTLRGKDTFFIYTCASANDGGKYGKTFNDEMLKKGFKTHGSYWCLGFDTFGPLVLTGGLYKDRPNKDDEAGAVAYFKEVMQNLIKE